MYFAGEQAAWHIWCIQRVASAESTGTAATTTTKPSCIHTKEATSTAAAKARQVRDAAAAAAAEAR